MKPKVDVSMKKLSISLKPLKRRNKRYINAKDNHMKKQGAKAALQFIEDNYCMIKSLETSTEQGCTEKIANVMRNQAQAVKSKQKTGMTQQEYRMYMKGATDFAKLLTESLGKHCHTMPSDQNLTYVYASAIPLTIDCALSILDIKHTLNSDLKSEYVHFDMEVTPQ